MTDVAATLAVLQFGDSLFPSGAVSFSWGLEGLAENGVVTGADGVRAFVIGQLNARWASFDRAVVVAAHRAMSDLDDIAAIDDQVEIQTPSAELRSGSRRMGEALLSVASRLGIADAAAYRDRVKQGAACGHLAPMQGLVWGRAGLSEGDAVALSAHTFCTGLLSAAHQARLSHPYRGPARLDRGQGGGGAHRGAPGAAADRSLQLRHRGRDRRDAIRNQRHTGIRQLGSRKKREVHLVTDANGTGTADRLCRRGTCPQAQGEGAQAQSSRGRRLYRRRDPGRRPRGALGRRSHLLGLDAAHLRRRQARRRRLDADDPGGGHVSRRHQARDHPRPDPAGQREAACRCRGSRRDHHRRRRHRAQRRAGAR